MSTSLQPAIPGGPVDPENLDALLARAIAIASRVHETQRDKAGAAYILHPLRLMARAQTPEEQIVAMLHDVVEDSPDHPDPALRYPLSRLRAEGFTGDLLAAIDLVTARADENYDAFIERIATAPGKAGRIARRVKLLDLEDNLALTRITTPSEKDWERLRRYHGVRLRLLAAIATSDIAE